MHLKNMHKRQRRNNDAIQHKATAPGRLYTQTPEICYTRININHCVNIIYISLLPLDYYNMLRTPVQG